MDMKQSRLGIVLSLLLAFAAGAAAGIFAERLLFTPRWHRGQGERGPSPEKWEKELAITEDQKARIHEIFKNNDIRVNELRSDFWKKVGEIQAEIRKEIDAVLTPEQRAKQDAMMEKYREARKKENDKRSSSSSPRPKEKPSKENTNEEENRDRGGDPGSHRGYYPGLFPY